MAGKPDGDRRRVHLIVGGRVQGVGFRYFVRERARAQALAGWVRNLADGRVELVAEGGGAAVEALRRDVARGPQGAHVDAVEERPADAGELPTPFAIVR